MANRSIRLQFLLWTWGFFLLVLCGVFLFATGRAERAVVAEAEERAKTSLGLVAYLFSHESGLGTESGLAAFADALGPHLGFRLTYIVSGRVVADSAVRAADLAEMEDHAGRPEVREAKDGKYGQDLRTSRTLGRDMLYVAEAYPGGNGVPAGILRLALPVSSLAGELARFRNALLAVLAMVFAAGGVAAYGLARGMSRSLGEIADVVAAVGQGHYDRRIHLVWARDFEPLAKAINALATRIGEHVREIEERRKHQEAVFESLAEGVAIIKAGRIVAGNRALRAMFPKLPDTFGRTPIEAGMPVCVERALAAFDPGDGQAQRAGRYELSSARVTELTVAALSGGEDSGTRVLTFHDVTEAVTMDRIFRDFVIDASHSLRAPLAKVRGFAETARGMFPARTDSDRAGDAPAEALEAVIGAVADMQGLIDGLLTAARGRYAAAKAATASDVMTALKQALVASNALLRAKGVTARLVGAPQEPLPVLAGHEEMVRAFCSILSQTPDDVSIAVTVTREKGHALVRFEGPANLGIVMPVGEFADGGGEAVLDGAARVVRLPLVAG